MAIHAVTLCKLEYFVYKTTEILIKSRGKNK